MKAAIRKGFGPYSSGTRVEVLASAQDRQLPKGVVNHGYSTVRVNCDKRVIDIEDDNLVYFRRR